jgi:predicted metal-dependent hydrolase
MGLYVNAEVNRNEDAWRRGIEQFNRREFFECHESWEQIWLPAPEPDKTFLQGIIQVACAFHHELHGNRAGAESLLRRGLAKVEPFPAGYRGIELEAVRATARRWSEAFARGDALPVEELPVILAENTNP